MVPEPQPTFPHAEFQNAGYVPDLHLPTDTIEPDEEPRNMPVYSDLRPGSDGIGCTSAVLAQRMSGPG